MIKARIVGQGSLGRRLRRRLQAQHASVGKAVTESLAEVQQLARRNLEGRSFSRRGTGALAKSVTARHDASGLGGSVGTDLSYGRYLEFGTRRMAARPWLQPAFESLKPQIRRRLIDAVRNANRIASPSAFGQGGRGDEGIGS